MQLAHGMLSFSHPCVSVQSVVKVVDFFTTDYTDTNG